MDRTLACEAGNLGSTPNGCTTGEPVEPTGFKIKLRYVARFLFSQKSVRRSFLPESG